LVITSLPFVLFVLLLAVLSMRVVKSEMTDALLALIESKKVYVRYISHEMRTPLNAILLGLTLLTHDLQASDNPKDIDRCI
jgi:signal transduction histidine kinase